ncbi:MAG TPA: serine protease, partial [Pseudomonadales bacterium]|nr:serine protease [Pseudomonadales bacterium]
MRYFLKLAAFCLSLGLAVTPAHAKPSEKDKANELYRTWQPSIYQIRIMENTSKDKTAIGSGFQISSDGLIATNYHVVSFAVDAPERYKMEFVGYDGATGPLKLIAVDVVHDLAIVKQEQPRSDTPFIPLSQQPTTQGTRLYSMGNPHDLGMAVVEGTYNGLLNRSLYERIFFSG